MAAQIKITQLTDIGSANIATTTVLPVVNMAGVATTQKTTLGNLANVILSQSGSNYARAANANIAYSVANAAQPNITSVGTLTTLTVSGNTNLGAVGNVKITGGTAGQILSTDGTGNLSWVSDANGGSYGNSDVATFLASYGSNTITTTGNISVGNIIGNGQALTGIAGANVTGTVANANYALHVDVNPTTNNFSYHIVMVANPGDNSLQVDDDDHLQYNPADGTLTTYRLDANILNITNEVASNMIPFSNVTYDLGNNTNRWKDIYLANSTIYLGDATLSANGNSIVVDSITVTNGNVGTVGNIASINLDGSGSNVLYGNGVFAPVIGGGGSNISNGTSNVSIPVSNGNVEVTAGTQHWAFGTDGTLTAPNDSQIVPAGNNFNIYTNGVNGAVQFFTDVTGNNHNWAFDGYGYTQLPFSQGYTNTAVITTVGAGNLMLQAGAGPTQNFMFGSDGAVTFPTLTVDLHNGGNQTAQTLQFGDASQQAIITGPTPAVDTNAQRLIIQGQRGNGVGEGGDVYVWAGDANTNGGDIKIYAGDADSGNGYGGYINIDAGNGPDGGGQLSLSGGYSSNGQGGTVNIGAGQGGTDGGAVNINGGGAGANQGGNIALTGGYGGNNGGEVRLTGGSAGTGLPGYGNVVLVSGASTWTFDNGSNLTLPGEGIIQSINDTVILRSVDANSNIYSARLGTNGGLYFETTEYPTGWLSLTNNLGNANITAVSGTAGGAGKNIYINAGDADQSDYYTSAGGNITITGGLGAFNDGGGGGPGGNINLTAGISSDPAGHAGNINITSGSKAWTFDYTGNLILAGGSSVIQSIANSSLDPLNPNVSTMTLTPDANYNSQVLVLDPTAPGHIHLRAYAFSNIDEPAANIFLGGEDTAFEITSGANNEARIHSGGNTWTFSPLGDFILADGNGIINSFPNSSGDGSGLSTLNLVPDSTTGDDRYIVVDPTGPNHIHLRAGGLQDASNVLLYLGGEQTYVQVDDGYHRVTIGSYDIGNTTGYNWRFDYDGNLVLPLNTFAVKYANGTQVPIVSSASGSNNQIQFNSNGAFGASANYTFTDTVGGGSVEVGNELLLLGNGTISTSSNNLNIQPAGNLVVTASAYNWTFDTNGVLTLPGNLISSGASPAPTISGFSSISSIRTVTTPQTLASLTATAGARAFASDANLVAAGNFGQQVSGGGSNTTPVWSDGTNWYIG